MFWREGLTSCFYVDGLRFDARSDPTPGEEKREERPVEDILNKAPEEDRGTTKHS